MKRLVIANISDTVECRLQRVCNSKKFAVQFKSTLKIQEINSSGIVKQLYLINLKHNIIENYLSKSKDLVEFPFFSFPSGKIEKLLKIPRTRAILGRF